MSIKQLRNTTGLVLVFIVVLCLQQPAKPVDKDKVVLASECIQAILDCHWRQVTDKTITVSTREIEEVYKEIRIPGKRIIFASGTDLQETAIKSGWKTRYYEIEELTIIGDEAFAKVNAVGRFDEGYGIWLNFRRVNGEWGAPEEFGGWIA